MTLLTPPETPHPTPVPLPRRSAAAVGALAFLLLALPFLFLGLWLLDVKARVALECAPGGDCTYSRAGWLTREQVARFPPAAITGTRVERNRAGRGGTNTWRAEVLTRDGGALPLSFRYAADEAGPRADAEAVERLRREPARGLTLVRDERRASAGVGGAFFAVGLGTLALAGVLALRWRRQRAATRATAARR